MEQRDINDKAPISTKYTPLFDLVHLPIAKNVKFGEKGEVENKMKLDAIRKKINEESACTKGSVGADRCFTSVKRVKQLSKDFIREAFRRQ